MRDRQTDRCFSSSNVVDVPVCCREEGAEPEGKLSIYWSVYISTLTYGHELWVVSERTESWRQAVEMSFLHWVAGRFLRDRVRTHCSSTLRGASCICICLPGEASQAYVSRLAWECLRIPPDEIGEVFRRGKSRLFYSHCCHGTQQWMKQEKIDGWIIYPVRINYQFIFMMHRDYLLSCPWRTSP